MDGWKGYGIADSNMVTRTMGYNTIEMEWDNRAYSAHLSSRFHTMNNGIDTVIAHGIGSD